MLSVVNEKDMFNEQSKAPKRKPTKEYVRIYKLFMQNKPKVKYAKNNISTYLTMRYGKLDIWLFRQTKPKQTQLKPIQTQFNPKQTQFKPIQTQFKPNNH